MAPKVAWHVLFTCAKTFSFYIYMVPAGGRQPPPMVSPPYMYILYMYICIYTWKTYVYIYIHIYLDTYVSPLHTYIHYITLHYITLHYITYIHTCLYLPTYVGTHILHPTHRTGGGGEAEVPCMIVGFQGGSTPNPRNHPHRGGGGGGCRPVPYI